MTTTELFQTMKSTEAAFQADDLNIDLLQIADKAYAAWNNKVSELREEWMAIPSNDAKFSAETNAEDTEGTAEDELCWLEVAVSTYRMNIDAGYYNKDGSAI